MKIKVLMSCTVTAQLICAFVFAYRYAKSMFSNEAAHICLHRILRPNERFKNSKPAQFRRKSDDKGHFYQFSIKTYHVGAH